MAFEIDTVESETAEETKRARILAGAIKVFLAYGYARTTMDDIARAAEVSRPALYLLFKNKADIYRAIAVSMLDESVEAARKAMATDRPFAERMVTAIDKALISMLESITQAPHGAEILDMKNNLASDVVMSWHTKLGGHIAQAIASEAQKNDLDLEARGVTPRALADLLLDGLEGMKMRTSGPDEQRRTARELVRIIELAIRPSR